MSHISILKNLTITWPTGLVIVMTFCVVNSSSHAQTGAGERSSAPASRQGDSLAEKPLSGPNAETDQRNSQSRNEGSAPGQGASDQSVASTSKGCTEENLASCDQSTPQQESFLHKLIRILYGPDTPPGPNPDVDTNISAGGAAGG